jgi:hypothetical protein
MEHIFTKKALVAWLEKQPRHGTYAYFDTDKCLFGRYFQAMGLKYTGIGGEYWRSGPWTEDYGNTKHRFPKGWAEVGCDSYGSNGGHTFGAALKRARQLPD